MKENELFGFFCQQGILLLRLSKVSLTKTLSVQQEVEDNNKQELACTAWKRA
jgi:hypothetical protein